jgi:ribosomal protein S18 acetylase RimI-like enzyme
VGPGRSGLRVRAARDGDLDALWRIEQDAFEPHRRASRESLKRSLESPHQRVWVAEAGRDVVAFLIVWFRSRTWRVYDVAVKPGMQGLGYGRALMAVAERTARATGAERVVLEADAERTSYYERMGYVVTHDLTHFYGEGKHAVRLEKRVGPRR